VKQQRQQQQQQGQVSSQRPRFQLSAVCRRIDDGVKSALQDAALAAGELPSVLAAEDGSNSKAPADVQKQQKQLHVGEQAAAAPTQQRPAAAFTLQERVQLQKQQREQRERMAAT
jgi:hypothetical protein